MVSGLRGRRPWVGNKAGVPWRRAVHGGRGHPYHSGSRPPGFSGHDLRGVPVRRRGPTCSSRPPLEPAAGASGRVTLRLPSRAGGSVPSASGGGGRGPCGRRAGGGAGGGGGCRAAASLLSFPRLVVRLQGVHLVGVLKGVLMVLRQGVLVGLRRVASVGPRMGASSCSRSPCHHLRPCRPTWASRSRTRKTPSSGREEGARHSPTPAPWGRLRLLRQPLLGDVGGLVHPRRWR